MRSDEVSFAERKQEPHLGRRVQTVSPHGEFKRTPSIPSSTPHSPSLSPINPTTPNPPTRPPLLFTHPDILVDPLVDPLTYLTTQPTTGRLGEAPGAARKECQFGWILDRLGVVLRQQQQRQLPQQTLHTRCAEAAGAAGAANGPEKSQTTPDSSKGLEVRFYSATLFSTVC